jgi:hypothetical protein
MDNITTKKIQKVIESSRNKSNKNRIDLVMKSSFMKKEGFNKQN